MDHCSFKENGGIWPTHCVQNTIGAGIPVELLKTARNYVVYNKGMLKYTEEYGAFELTDNLTFNETYNSMFYKNSCLDDVVICGIAGDYCVLETLKNIVNEVDSNKVNVYLDGIVSIDGGEKLNNFINANNIKIYK